MRFQSYIIIILFNLCLPFLKLKNKEEKGSNFLVIEFLIYPFKSDTETVVGKMHFAVGWVEGGLKTAVWKRHVKQASQSSFKTKI